MILLGLGLNRRSCLLNSLAPLIKCGLESYAKGITSNTMIDKVGKSGTESGRDAVQGRTILYSAGSYIKAVAFASESLTYIDAVTNLPVVSAWDGSGEFLIPTNGIKGLTTQLATVTYTLDINPDNNVYSLIPSDNSAQIDVQQYLAPATPTEVNITQEDARDLYGYTVAIRNEVENYDFSNGTTGWANGTSVIDKILLANDYRTYTSLPSQKNDDVYFLYAKVKWIAGTATNIGIGFTGALKAIVINPVQDNWYDIFDKNTITGVSSQIFQIYANGATSINVDGNAGVFAFNLTAIDNALGTNFSSMTAEQINAIKYDLLALQIYRDALETTLYSTGHKIPNYSNGLSVGYKSGEHFAGTFSGRVKYNYSIVGDVFKIADKYNGMIVDDTSHIFYDASGNINTLSWAGMSNITNEQLFINKTTNQVGFFENALTPGTDCYDKAVFFMGLADQLFDSLASPLEDSTNDKLYSTT